MLSIATNSILWEIAKESDALYPQGGLVYKYTHGHRCAHCDIPDILKEIITTEFSQGEIHQLSLFLASAIETPYPKEISNVILELTQNLLTSIKKDFSGYFCCLSKYEEDSTCKELHLLFTKDNDYHELELFWSID